MQHTKRQWLQIKRRERIWNTFWMLVFTLFAALATGAGMISVYLILQRVQP